MTELNSLLSEFTQKECQNYDESFQNLISKSYTHTYYTYEHRIPISEINQDTCMCMELNHHMMKPAQCKGNCKDNRPFFVFDLKKPETADMIDNFTCNVEFTIYIGGMKLNKNRRILTLCSVFSGAYALIYLDQPNMPNEIIFSKRLHNFEYEKRRQIINQMNPKGILDEDLIYKYGMIQII